MCVYVFDLCLPGQQASRPPARPTFLMPDKDTGVGGDLHVPQEGHRRSLPPPTPETVLGLWSRFFGVGAESVETTSRKPLAPGLRITSLVLTLTWLPPSQCPVSVRRSLEFRAGRWVYPSHQLTLFYFIFVLFFFSVCVFPNLFTSVSPFILSSFF